MNLLRDKTEAPGVTERHVWESAFAALRRETAVARYVAIMLIDAAIALASLPAAVYLRIGGPIDPTVWSATVLASPLFAAIFLLVVHVFGIHRQAWRFASLRDMAALLMGATISVLATVPFLHTIDKLDPIPRSAPAIQWLVLAFLLCSSRASRRLLREVISRSRPPREIGAEPPQPELAVLAGDADAVDSLLRDIERGEKPNLRPVGALCDEPGSKGLKIRGVPVLGGFDDLAQAVEKLDAEGRRPDCLVVLAGAHPDAAAKRRLLAAAPGLGLRTVQFANFNDAPMAPGATAAASAEWLQQLLGRPQIMLDRAVAASALSGKRVLITGAGGSIGQELARQVAALSPAKLVLLDNCEFNLFSIDLELAERYPRVRRAAVLCSICERERLMQVFREHAPEVVFHAAALKHVPLVEANVCAAVLTNVIGTRNVADAALHYRAAAMVQISTDKAVNPIGAMGATKRVAELYCQALDAIGRNGAATPRFITVRFGNVIGSSGSLIPLFQKQLANGGPLTVTHPEIERFFMSISEAVQLVLHGSASAMGDAGGRGRILVLDMGEPIKIVEIARRMIRSVGLRPDVDVKIEFIGLRPGEKLYEELFDASEKRSASAVDGIFQASSNPLPLEPLSRVIDALAAQAEKGDERAVVRLIGSVVPTFGPQPARSLRADAVSLRDVRLDALQLS